MVREERQHANGWQLAAPVHRYAQQRRKQQRLPASLLLLTVAAMALHLPHAAAERHVAVAAGHICMVLESGGVACR